MIFHIRRSASTVATHCGYDAYQSTSQHLCTEAAVENPRRPWFEGDSVCLACIAGARPRPLSWHAMACRYVCKGDVVVLCTCGGVKPQGHECGKLHP